MATDRAAKPAMRTVRRVRTPAGDPAWQVNGYREIKQLLTDPRLGGWHPQPGQAARYSKSVFNASRVGPTRRPSGLSKPGFGRC